MPGFSKFFHAIDFIAGHCSPFILNFFFSNKERDLTLYLLLLTTTKITSSPTLGVNPTDGDIYPSLPPPPPHTHTLTHTFDGGDGL